ALDGEPGAAVLVRDRGGEPVPEVEEVPRLGFALVARVHPAADGPAGELAAADVHAAVELPGQQVGHRRLARRLHPGHQPDAHRVSVPAAVTFPGRWVPTVGA